MRGHGAADADDPKPLKKVKGYTGPYKYKDKDRDSIETVTMYMLKDLKTFKGAKGTETEWLTKENPVEEKINEFYHPHKGQEDI